jgi:hypothetical protein
LLLLLLFLLAAPLWAYHPGFPSRIECLTRATGVVYCVQDAPEEILVRNAARIKQSASLATGSEKGTKGIGTPPGGTESFSLTHIIGNLLQVSSRLRI